jgi:hypothetical protein
MAARGFLLVLLGAALAGCGGTVLPRRVTSKGFIAGPLEVLDPLTGLAVSGREGFRSEPRKPILLDAVSIWRPLEAPAGEIPRQELEALAYEVREAMGAALEEDLAVTRVPIPGSLTARLAIAEKASSWIVFEHLGTSRPLGDQFADSGKLSPAMQALLSRAVMQVVIAGGPQGKEVMAAGEARILASEVPRTDWTWGRVRQTFRDLAVLLRGGLRRDGGERRGESPPGGDGR